MDDRIEALLKQLGLTEYEAKAFLTLAKFGTLTADKISNLGEIPLPRVYDTLEELNKKGFVFVGKSRPKAFKAVDMEKALKNFIELQKSDYLKKLEIQKQMIPQVSELLDKLEIKPSVREERWNVWTIGRKGSVDRLLMELKNNAKKEVCVFTGDLSWIREKENLKTYRYLLKKGVKFRVITKTTAENKSVRENIQIAKKLGMKVCSGYGGNLRCNIVDGRILALTSKIPKSGADPDSGAVGSDRDFEYEVMVIDNAPIANAIQENFNFWWEKLTTS